MISRLCRLELRQFWRGSQGPLLAAALIVALGVHFTLMGGGDAFAFLAFTYIWLPTLFVVPASLSVLSERATRLSDLTLSAPLSRSEYYGGKLLASLALAGIYLVATTPFAAAFVWLAGPKWILPLLAHFALGAFVAAFACCAGALVTVAFHGRALVTAVIATGLAAALALAWSIFGGAAYARGDADAAWLKALLLSPAFTASNASALLRQVASPAPAIILVTGTVLALGLALAGWWAFTRLQDADGWDAPPRATIIFAILLVVGLVGVAAATPPVAFTARSPTFYFDPPPDETSGISYTLTMLPGKGALVGESYESPIVVTFTFKGQSRSLRDAVLHLASSDMRFEPDQIPLGDITTTGDSAVLRPDVVVHVESTSAAFGGTSRLQHRVVSATDGFDSNGVVVVGVKPRVDSPFGIPIAISAGLAAFVAAAPRIRRANGW